MTALLPTGPLLLAFVAASLVLAATPGPGVVYIVTRSLAQGRAAGLASVAGVALGNLGNAIGASLGLAAVLAVSSAAFMAVKSAGAAYLVYLGIQTLRKPALFAEHVAARPRVPALPVFLDGFVVALLNPKTALFFGAFLPQFFSADAPSALRSVALGSLFVAIAAATDALYALTAATLGPRLRRGVRLRTGGRYLASGALIGLGLFTALSGARDPGKL